MRIDLNIVSYNRPQYLSLLLASLQQQHCKDFQIGSVHLFQDGPKQKRHDEDAQKIFGWPITFDDLIAHNLMGFLPAGVKGCPAPEISKMLDTDYGGTFGLLGSGHRKEKGYQFPYAV